MRMYVERPVDPGDAGRAPAGPCDDRDAGSRRPSCSICARRLGREIAYLDETGDVPPPRQSWVLCTACDAAVRAELERSPVQGPLRTRVAVGVVAAERSPTAVRRARSGMHDDAWLHFLFWGFGIAMVIHVFIIAAIALLIR